MDGLRITLTKANYDAIRDSHYGSKNPLPNKQVLAYLNASRGLKGKILSFAVEGTAIRYTDNRS